MFIRWKIRRFKRFFFLSAMMTISIQRVLAKLLSFSRDCVYDKPVEKSVSSETLKSATD